MSKLEEMRNKYGINTGNKTEGNSNSSKYNSATASKYQSLDTGANKVKLDKNGTLQSMRNYFGISESDKNPIRLNQYEPKKQMYELALQTYQNRMAEERKKAKENQQIQAEATPVTPNTTKSTPNYGRGNIDLNSRPTVDNGNGSYSTVDSVAFDIDGKVVSIPTVIYEDGQWKHVDDQTALEHYKKTGEYLGIFDTKEEEEAYSNQLHEDQAKQYDAQAAQSAQNTSILDKIKNSILGNPAEVTNTETDWGKLIQGTLYKGADQFVAGTANTLDLLFGGLAEELHVLGGETVNGILETFGAEPIDYGKNFLSRWAENRKKAKEQNLNYFDANSKSSRAAQVVDKFGTSTVAALPMAIETLLFGATNKAAEAASKTPQALQYVSNLFNSSGLGVYSAEAVEATKNLMKSPDFWTSYLWVAGDSYDNAIQKGMSEDDAAIYSVVNGAINAMIEIGGGDESLGGLQAMKNNLQHDSAILAIGKSMLGEGLEEVEQGVFERGLQSWGGVNTPIASTSLYDDSSIFNPYTALDEFAGGAIVGAVLGAGHAGADTVINTFESGAKDIVTEAKMKKIYGSSVQELINEGLESPEDSKSWIQAQYCDRMLKKNGKLTGFQIRRLVEANIEQIREEEAAAQAQNVSQETPETVTSEVRENATETQEETAKAEQTVPKVEQNAEKPEQNQKNTSAPEEIQKADEQKAVTSEVIDESEKKIRDTASKLGLAEDEANVLVDDYKIGNTGNADIYANGVKEVFDSVKNGLNAQQIKENSVFAKDLTEKQFDHAFRMAQAAKKENWQNTFVRGATGQTSNGLTDAKDIEQYNLGRAKTDTKAEASQADIDKKKQAGPLQRKIGTVSSEGVKLEDLKNRFNDPQRTAYRALSKYAEVTGVDIVLYQSEADENGNYTASNGRFEWKNDKIYIDINSGILNEMDATDFSKYVMLRTFSHEFTHFTEKWNPKEYATFQRMVFQYLEDNGQDTDALIKSKQMLDETGKMTYYEAAREVVADAMTDVLPQSSFMETMAQENPSLFNHILTKFRQFVARLKQYFNSLKMGTQEAEALKKNGQYAETLVKAYDKLATGAVENYQAVNGEQLRIEPAADAKKKTEAKPTAQKPAEAKPVKKKGRTEEEKRAQIDKQYENEVETASQDKDRQAYLKKQYEQYADIFESVHDGDILYNEEGITAEVYNVTGKGISLRYFNNDGEELGIERIPFGTLSVMTRFDSYFGPEDNWFPKVKSKDQPTEAKTEEPKKAEVTEIDVNSLMNGLTAAQEKANETGEAQEVKLSDHAVEAPQDEYTNLASELKARNIFTGNGIKFTIDYAPGASNYTGTITRAREGIISNARDRIYTSPEFSSRQAAIDDIVAVARNNKLLEQKEEATESKNITEVNNNGETDNVDNEQGVRSTPGTGEGTSRLLDEVGTGDVQGTGRERRSSENAEKSGRRTGRNGDQSDAKRNGRSRSNGSSESGDLRGADRVTEENPKLKEVVIDLTQKPTEEEVKQHQEQIHEETEIQVTQQSTEQPKGSNYVIGDTLDLPNGSKARYKANVAAIRLVKQLEAEARFATAEEQQVLSKYVGWGGLSEAFDEKKADWSKEYAELKEVLTEEEYEAARASTLNAHYTSIPVIKAMYRGLEKLGFKGGRMLEPSSGVGNFVGAMPVSMSSNVRSWTMVELDNITGLIAKYLYPNADVRIEGFEKAIIPNDFMDVAIGNVPFGKFGVTDRAYPASLTNSIHNYFFVKTLDKVRPGGIVMYITTAFTMDSKDNTYRTHIAKKANLLGAIRLPNNAFSGNAGTKVVTDILVFQKKGKGELSNGIDFVKTPYTNVSGSYYGTHINEYFAEHPEMVLGENVILKNGMYGQQEYSVNPYEDRGSLESQIDKAFENIQGQITYPERKSPEKVNEDVQKAEKKTKNGSYYKKNGKLVQNVNGIEEEFTGDKATQERIDGMLDIRDVSRELLNAQKDGLPEKEIKALRKKLNEKYDAFVKKNGYLNSPKNKKAFEADPDRFGLLALENYDGEKKTATKADIFTVDTVKPAQTIDHVDTVREGLIVSRNTTGGVDVDLIARLTGNDRQAVEKELVASELVFKDRDGNLIPSEVYLQGNVRAKLRDAQGMVGIDKDYQHNVDALQRIMPADVPHEAIYVQPGTPWISDTIYSDFAAHMLGTSNEGYWGPAIKIHRSPETGAFTIKLNKENLKHSYQNTQQWGTPARSFLNLFEAVLNSRSVTVSHRDEDGKSYVDKVATAAANEKVEKITEEFQKWLWQDESRTKDLEYLYNETFNAFVTQKYDGSTLVVNGMRSGWNLRPHQADAVQRIVSSGGNVLLAHKVGAGKTLEMSAAAMKLKELGIISKPMFIVPKKLVAQWGKEFKTYFPMANLLVAEEGDFTPANRRTFTNRISTGSYDAIIVSYEQFEKVPMSDEYTAKMYQEQINEIIAAIEEQKAASGAKSMSVKDLEKKKKQLQQKIDKLTGKKKDTDNIQFEDLGIDSIFVDEAHNFKNLFYTTSMNNVSGLNNKNGSGRAFDLYTKVRYLQQLNGGKGIVFATATPVMNSMSEMYIMQKYLQSDLLNQLGLTTFDAWAKQFGEIVNGIEIKPSGQGYRVKQSFSRFKNLNELQMLFRSFSDVLTDVPGLKIPKLKGGKVQIVTSEPGEFQNNFMKELAERAENVKNVSPKQDNMLKITSDGRKISYTQRMIDPSLPYEENCKIYKCAENVKKEYDASTNVTVYDEKEGKNVKLKGTQIIFLDMATPKGKSNSENGTEKESETNNDAPYKALEKALNRNDSFRRKDYVFAITKDRSGKYVSTIEYIDDKDKSFINTSNCFKGSAFEERSDAVEELIIAAENGSYLDGDTDESAKLYEDLKARLVKLGIPAKEIAFIHDANTDQKTSKLYDDVNAGSVRVLIGSTGKMGVGMNAQKRIVAIHHLDAPWRPGDVEQRNGRAFRQGNLNAEVSDYTYVTEGSFDSRLWDILERKQRFIDQIMNGDNVGREAEDTGEVTLSAAEVKAVASGNPMIMEQVQIENDIKKLENLYTAYRESLIDARINLKEAKEKLAFAEIREAGLAQDIKNRTNDYLDDSFKIKIGNKTYTDKKLAGEAFNAAALANAKEGEYTSIGSFAGFDIQVIRTKEGISGQLFGKQGYSIKTYPDNATYNITQMIKLLGNFDGMLENFRESEKNLKNEIEAQNGFLNQPFDKQAELDSKRARYAEIMDILNPKEAQQIDEEEDSDDEDAVQYSRRPMPPTSYSEEEVFLDDFGDDTVQYSRRVQNPETLAFLDRQEAEGKVVKVYKTLQLDENGGLHSPVNGKEKVEGERKLQWTFEFKLGSWVESAESMNYYIDPKNGKAYVNLNKGNGKTLSRVAYNPYQHGSNDVLNDQFEEAYQRPNLVTVECIIPASELTSGYHAKDAKDSVGRTPWHAGPIASKLKGDDKRVLYLSRWMKPVRIMPDSEVAKEYEKILSKYDNIQIPFNVVTPSLLSELEKIGMPIDYSGSPTYRAQHKGKAVQESMRQKTLSNTELLAMAADEIPEDKLGADEKAALDIFKTKLGEIRMAELKRKDLGIEYKEATFKKGASREKSQQIKNKIDIYDNRIKRLHAELLSLENKDILKGILVKARQVVEEEDKKKLDETLTKYRERVTENAEVRRWRQHVKEDVADLQEWLMKPSNKNAVKHVPAEIQKSVADFIASINLMSKTALRTSGLETTKADERYLKALKKMKDAIKSNREIQGAYSGYADLPEDFAETFEKLIMGTEAYMDQNRGEFVVNLMNSDQLRKLDGVLKTLKKYIKTVNSFHNNAMFEHAYEAGENTIEYLTPFKKSNQSGRVYNFLDFRYVRPSYVFERMGKGGVSIEREFREGQAVQARLAKQIIDFSHETFTREEVEEWSKDIKTFTTEDGETINIPATHIMSLYCLTNRPTALTHIYGDGIRVANFKDNNGKAELDEGHIVTQKDVEDMLNTLTDRQIEVAQALQNFMSTVCSEWGNYVSMARFDVEQFTERYYFPINSDGRYLSATADEMPDNAGLYALLNTSFTKAPKENAKTRIILYNIFDVFANHTASMTQYRSFALPLLDALKWFNYKNDNTSVRAKLSMAFGAPLEERAGSGSKGFAETFVLNLLRAYNGTAGQNGTDNATEQLLTESLHKFNAAQVAFNFRVVVQQPMAITRAAMLISPEKLMKGLGMSIAQYKKLAAEMEEYSGIAAWKSLGFYDTNISRGLTTLIKQNADLREKVTDVGMKGAEFADRFTWAAMWYACKDTVDRSKYSNNEDYMKAVTDLFEEVIYKTQVVDSILTKAEYLRGKDIGSRMFGSFMSEPSATMSMLGASYNEYQDAMRRGTARSEAWQEYGPKIAKTAAVYAIGQILLAAVQSIMDAWRDDDDFKTFMEKYLDAFKSNIIDELNPLSKLPIISELYEITKYALDQFGVFEKLGLDMYGNTMGAAISAVDYFKKVIDIGAALSSGRTGYTNYALCYNIVRAAADITGYPAGTAMREVVDIWNNTVGELNPNMKLRQYESSTDRNKREGWSNYAEPAGIDKDVYNYVMNNADTDGNGNIKQDEMGEMLKNQINQGNITTAQANAMFKIFWHDKNSKTYSEWRKKN